MTDAVGKVRARAVDLLTHTLDRVKDLPASNAPLFMEYIFPQLMSAISGMNNEPVVLLAVARNIGTLAGHAVRFAELSAAAVQSGSQHATAQPSSPNKKPAEVHAAVEVESFDVQLKHVQEATKKIVKALLECLPAAGHSSPADRHGISEAEELMMNMSVGRDVKIALLRNMCVLADCFGRDGTHTFLLPYLISFMNDPAWEVRAAFCEEAALLPKKVGQVSSEGIIWPCYDEALRDQEERVLEAALRGLCVLAAQHILQRQSLVTMAKKVAPLLVHPSDAIRLAAAEAISSVASQLSSVDQHVFLMPAVRPFLHLEASSLSALTVSLLSLPVNRHSFKQVLLKRDQGLREAILQQKPFPNQPCDASKASNAVLEPGDDLMHSGDVANTELTTQDLSALELLRPYLHSLLRSRPSKALVSSDEAECLAGKVQSLQYATVNPSGAPNRSLAALAEASDGVRHRWLPPVPRGTTVARHPLGLFSMHTYLAKAFCLPPRPCELGCLSFLDGTPYSIYALSSVSMTSTSVASSARAEVGDGCVDGGGTEQFDSSEPLVDSSMVIGSDRTSQAAPAFRGMWARSSEPSLIGAIDTEAKGRSRASSLNQATWRPKGQLMATLYEFAHHGGVPVVKVDTTDDSRILITGGRDGVVKIWSCAQLDRDTAVGSSHTFSLPSRPNVDSQRQRLRALRTVRNSKAFACGTETGDVLLYKIEPSRGGASAVQACRFSASANNNNNPASSVMCIEQFDTELESLVVFAQDTGFVHGWDVRGSSASWSLNRVPPWLGVPNCLALGSDGHSAIIGTLGGGLLVYDLRFLAPYRQWKVSTGTAVLSMRSADVGPSQGAFVSLGSECNEVALFDLSRGSCSTLFLTGPVGEKPGGEKQKGTTVSVPSLLPIQAGSCPPNSPDYLQPLLSSARKGGGSVRSLWLPPGGAQTFLLAGGADRKVRHWSLDPEHHAAEAYVVTPSEAPGNSDRVKATYSSNHHDEVFVVQEQEIQQPDGPGSTRSSSSPNILDASRPSTASPNHRDAILDMCAISLQHDILVTAGRHGLVKLWR
eukprot:TRINITY_DN102123_c0_g1_i1.p1 TRINITY_DN102123_c0_g1~~TRINITY_DN102123_c0_g1_i1.p1  ORF type:complete len:1135 (+),score=177.74 TRINITY_DN102123_c0_g1_i1:247-3405(+)